ncbi:unnamed protein product [Nezara viridula]|uniref:Gustatory receptor n=1 Tax=Nezara viridula TaxID=85310 RepID=A0A9P0HBN0_NEZVI|nr:unnamed protein product [Nezara viridula]
MESRCRLTVFFDTPHSLARRVIFRSLSWPVWYTVFIVVLQVLGTCFILETVLNEISKRGNFDDSLYGLALTVSLFQSLAIPITYWWESSDLLRYFEDWYYFQEEFGRDDLDFALTGLIKTACIIHLPILISMLVGGAYLFNDFRFIVFSPCVTAVGSLSATLLFWCITLYELRAASDKLMKKIIGAGCRNMYQSRILWQKLSNLTTTLGESCGRTGLAVCVLIFTTFVLTTYGFLSLGIDHSFTKSFFAFLFTSLFCMTIQFIMCDAAHRTTLAVCFIFSVFFS